MTLTQTSKSERCKTNFPMATFSLLLGNAFLQDPSLTNLPKQKLEYEDPGDLAISYSNTSNTFVSRILSFPFSKFLLWIISLLYSSHNQAWIFVTFFFSFQVGIICKFFLMWENRLVLKGELQFILSHLGDSWQGNPIARFIIPCTGFISPFCREAYVHAESMDWNNVQRTPIPSLRGGFGSSYGLGYGQKNWEGEAASLARLKFSHH